MLEATLYDATGTGSSRTPLSEAVFGGTVNVPLLHQAVVRQQANARQGTHDTKTRGEVAGSTRKMWRQKGTGRARQGSKRAPHWRHGGVVFGPHPRSYRQGFPRKMVAGALRSALAAKAQASEIVVLESLSLERPSTKQMRRLLERVAPGRSTLLVLDTPNQIVRLSARNLPHVRTATTENLNALDIMRHQYLVLTAAALQIVEARYGQTGQTGETGQTGQTGQESASSAGPAQDTAASGTGAQE